MAKWRLSFASSTQKKRYRREYIYEEAIVYVRKYLNTMLETFSTKTINYLLYYMSSISNLNGDSIILDIINKLKGQNE